MPSYKRCPECGSYDITAKFTDVGPGEEEYACTCNFCGHNEAVYYSRGGNIDWSVPVTLQEPHRMHAADGVERTLLDQIYATPDDDGPRMVYADWLIERGDPLGTFMSMQLARARRGGSAAMEEERMLDENWSAWIGAPSAALEPRQLAFERGLWSACECVDVDPLAATQSRSWGTVRRLSVDEDTVEMLPELLEGPLHRSIREIVFAFEEGDPPPLEFPALPQLHTIGARCHPDRARRWLEHIAAARIANVILVMRPQPDAMTEALRAARSLPISRLVFEVAGTEITAVRDAGGTLAVQTIELTKTTVLDRVIAAAKYWQSHLAELIDPGVQVMLPTVDAELVSNGDAEGVKLVASTTAHPARPRAVRA